MLSKRKIEMPSPEEDAAIDAGIASDPDTCALSKTEFKQLQPIWRGRPAGSASDQAEQAGAHGGLDDIL